MLYSFLFIAGSAWDSGCILIHCKVGVSRSTTFALAFLMSKYEVLKVYTVVFWYNYMIMCMVTNF